MPITSPRVVTSGPPELPGIERGIGLNDVFDQAHATAPAAIGPRALTTPAVTEC